MRRWIRWISRIAIAIVVIAVLLVLAVALPLLMRTIAKPSPLLLETIIVIAIEAALIPLALIWWVWWRLPQRQVARLTLKIRDAKARADTEDNFRKTIGQALGGAAVLIGAVAAYLQFTQQQRASHDLLISNQVAKGFEQLANDKVTMRLGGIYALEGVMNTSMEYHQPVLEALCAFVRDSTIGIIVGTEPTTDVQATLTVIGRRADGLGRVNLTQANIPGSELSRSNLSRANLNGANLNGADLTDADLNHANLSLAGYEISTNLSRADLRGADLNHANLNFANLNRANLNEADLTDADLTGADLSGATLGGARLGRADLTISTLRDAFLSGANFNGALLKGANLDGANLNNSNLNGANLNNANLSHTALMDANLSDADLRYAHLNGALLNDVLLSSAILDGTDLSDAKEIFQSQLDQACGVDAKLPPGLSLKPCQAHNP